MKIIPTQLKYQKVAGEIRQLVQTLPVGARLPAERDLAISYQCSFLTVRKALKQMVDDGTLVRRVGSGTFIAKHAAQAQPKVEEKTVGVLVYQGSNAYAYRIMQSVAHAGLAGRINLKSSWIGDFSEDAIMQAEELARSGCVALTLPWFPFDKTADVRAFVKKCPLPVSLPMIIPGLEQNCFERQEIFGETKIEELCDYYRRLGKTRIAMIGPNSADDPILQKKLTAFVCYTSRENMPSPCGLVEPGAAAMDQLADRWKSYRGDLAIICYDDEHALRFMTAMHKLGLSAPEDFCIIGYNDTEASAYSDPPLTTVHQYYDYIGQWLLKSALALAEGRVSQASKRPKLQLLVRSTCGGRGKINAEFLTQFHELDILLDTSAAVGGSINGNGGRRANVFVDEPDASEDSMASYG